MSFAYALKWSFAAELAGKVIQPVVFIVLSRLLTPEDFGVITAAMMVIAFSQIFWEAGMGKALIQRQTDIVEAANAAFLINILLAVFIATLLYLFAQPIAQTFFRDNRVTAVLQVMVLHLLLGALSSVQTALLQKEMSFKNLFWVRFATVSLPSLTSIPLAWYGFGYWAIVAGILVSQLVQAIMLWRINTWRPSLRVNIGVTREILRFSVWVMLTGLLSWFYSWVDSLIVGHYLRPGDLGLFRMGSQLVSVCFITIFGPLTSVLFSYLSKHGGSPKNLQSAADKLLNNLVTVSVPLGISLALYSTEIQQILFGAKWYGIDTVIAAMALLHGYSWIVGMNGEFYRAMGRPNFEAIIMVIMLFIYLWVYLCVVNKGLESFVWARFCLGIGALFLHLALFGFFIDIDMFTIVRRILLVTGVSVLTVYLTKFIIGLMIKDVAGSFLVSGLVSSLILGFLIYEFERENLEVWILHAVRKGA